MVSRELEKSYTAITWAAIAAHKEHPQFRDIVSWANLEVWQRLARFPPEEREGKHALVHTIARQAALHFLRSPENQQRKRTRDGFALPEQVPLASLPAWLHPRVPDFAPRVVHRLWLQHVWEQVCRQADPLNRELLDLILRQGLTHVEVGALYGKPPNWSWRRLKRLFAPYARD